MYVWGVVFYNMCDAIEHDRFLTNAA